MAWTGLNIVCGRRLLILMFKVTFKYCVWAQAVPCTSYDGSGIKWGSTIAKVMTWEGCKVPPPLGVPPFLPFITSVQSGSPDLTGCFCQAVQRVNVALNWNQFAG